MAFEVLDGLLNGSPKDRLSVNRSDADTPILLIVWAYFCDTMAADCFARFEISSASALETNKLRGSSDNSFRRLDIVSSTTYNYKIICEFGNISFSLWNSKVAPVLIKNKVIDILKVLAASVLN